MLTKLTPEVLDKFDIFVLEVEELFVPKVRSESPNPNPMVMFDILAPDMGVVMAIISPGHIFLVFLLASTPT